MITLLKKPALAIGLSFAGAALACSPDGKGGFLPENDMYIPVGQKSIQGGVTEAQFNNAINKVESVYAPIVASLGGRLFVERRWTDGTVNAYAQQSGRTWSVSMFGGLARHRALTEDGMSLVVCHEIGHHIGGAPKKGALERSRGSNVPNFWSSAEGQADYFATLKCLRKVFLNDDNIGIVSRMTVPAPLARICKDASKNNTEDYALCVRMGLAGKSVGDLFSDLGKLPETKFDRPDRGVVNTTFESHPQGQCRLDTFIQGAICEVSMNEDVSNSDEVKGTCHQSLGYTTGARPRCWFRPTK